MFDLVMRKVRKADPLLAGIGSNHSLPLSRRGLQVSLTTDLPIRSPNKVTTSFGQFRLQILF